MYPPQLLFQLDVLSIFFFALSLVPLFRVTQFSDKPVAKPLSFKKFFAFPEGRRAFITNVFYATHSSVENTLFPLFIFMTFGTIQSVALVPLALAVVAIVSALILSRMQPKRRTLAIIFGAAAMAVVWALRIYMGSTPVYYASVVAVGLLTYFIAVPLDVSMYEYGRRMNDPLSTSMYRNLTYMATNVVLFGTLAILVGIFNVSFTLAAASLLTIVILNGVVFLTAKEHTHV